MPISNNSRNVFGGNRWDGYLYWRGVQRRILGYSAKILDVNLDQEDIKEFEHHYISHIFTDQS